MQKRFVEEYAVSGDIAVSDDLTVSQIVEQSMYSIYVYLFEYGVLGEADVDGVRSWIHAARRMMTARPSMQYHLPSNAKRHDKDSPAADCLIVIMGQTRAKQLTWLSFDEFLLEPSGCDLAVSVGHDAAKQSESADNNPYYDAAKYLWLYNETALDGESDAERWQRLLAEMYHEAFDKLGGVYNGLEFGDLGLWTEQFSKVNWTQNGFRVVFEDFLTFHGVATNRHRRTYRFSFCISTMHGKSF